jgi:hypothetical protein
VRHQRKTRTTTIKRLTTLAAGAATAGITLLHLSAGVVAKGGEVPAPPENDYDAPPQKHWPGLPLTQPPDFWRDWRMQDQRDFNMPPANWGPFAGVPGPLAAPPQLAQHGGHVAFQASPSHGAQRPA